MGFPRQEYWGGLPFPSPGGCILSELFTMPVCLVWPCTAFLIVSLIYTNPFAMTRLWSMKTDTGKDWRHKEKRVAEDEMKMKVKVTQSCPTLCDHVIIVHEILQARILEWVAFPFSRRSSQPRDQTQVSHIAGGFFTSWATGKPKNAGVGSLSLLQEIFLTQESNWGLLHCRQILYQLSYEGIP